MASVAYFTPAFQLTSATDSLPSHLHKTNTKRKRVSAVSDDDSDGEENEVPSSEGKLEVHSSVALGRESLSQDAAFQYETSGHSTGRMLPGSNFPHAFRRRPIDAPRTKARSNPRDKLAGLRSPLCVGPGAGGNVGDAKSGAIGLRQQHLIALTAILHKCVLEGDFVRAGRAWGMLLRAEHNGHSLDLRTNDRWGLGAEIIFRREAQLVRNKGESGGTFNNHGMDDRHHMPSCLFSPQVFEQVKDYYERLALQYPHRKAFPNTTGPQDFYVAMFSLWIYSVEKQHSLALAEIGKGVADGQRTDAGAVEQDHSGSISDTERRHHQQREAARKDTLQRIDDIAARLRELLMSPPYCDDTRYSQLQHMVDMWIKDLSEASGGSGNDDEGDITIAEGSSISSGY